MRNSKGNSPYSLVTTKTNIEDLIERMNLFEIALEHKDKCELSLLDDSSNYFIKKVLNKELEVEEMILNKSVQILILKIF